MLGPKAFIVPRANDIFQDMRGKIAADMELVTSCDAKREGSWRLFWPQGLDNGCG